MGLLGFYCEGYEYRLQLWRDLNGVICVNKRRIVVTLHWQQMMSWCQKIVYSHCRCIVAKRPRPCRCRGVTWPTWGGVSPEGPSPWARLCASGSRSWSPSKPSTRWASCTETSNRYDGNLPLLFCHVSEGVEWALTVLFTMKKVRSCTCRNKGEGISI